MLQYFETMDNKNASQAKARVKGLLELYNHEVETLSINCLGDTRIRAGNSILVTVSDAGVKNSRLIVRSVTHDFLPVHTMDIEVSL